MRKLILVLTALTFIALPLMAQESGLDTATSPESCKVNFGSFGAEPAEDEAEAEGEEGATAVGTETLTEEEAYMQDQVAYEEAQQAGGQAGEVEAQCEPPNASGYFVCYDDGQPLSCYCCDPSTETQIPYSDDCFGCCQ